MDILEVTKQAAKAAADKKASRIVGMNLTGLSDFCDTMLVCSADNEKQSQAIAESIVTHIKSQYGFRPDAVEGLQVGHWILIDYGSLIVHIFLASLRDAYAVEKLWPKAPTIPNLAEEQKRAQTSAPAKKAEQTSAGSKAPQFDSRPPTLEELKQRMRDRLKRGQ